MSEWLQHTGVVEERTRQREENHDARVRLWEAALRAATDAPELPGSGLLVEHYDTKPVVIGVGFFGIVFSASRGGKKYAVKMLFMDNEASFIKEVAMLLYLFNNIQGGTCSRKLVCYAAHFRARLGREFYTELFQHATTERKTHLSIQLGTSGSVRERYLQTGLVSFIETRLEKGQVMEELLYKQHGQVSDVVGGRTLSYQQNLALIISLVGAVRLLHRNFVYHQDIYAKNIMVVNYSPDRINLMPHAVLLDMGVACLVDKCEPPPQYPFQTKAQLLRVDRRRQYNDVMMLLDIIYDWLNGVYYNDYPPRRILPVQNQRLAHSPLWDIVKRNWEPAHRYDVYSHEFESIPGTFPHVTAEDLYTEFRALIFPSEFL